MKGKCATMLVRSLAALSLICILACSRSQDSREHPSQPATTQDERTRERVADATQRAKEKSKQLGEKIDAAGKKLERNAEAVADGVKEGWNRKKYPLDLNSASESELRGLPGLTQDDARRIVDGRPYHNGGELVSRRILTEEQYRGVRGLVIAK